MSNRKKKITDLKHPVSIKISKDIVKKILRNKKESDRIVLDNRSLNIIYSPLRTLNLEILFSLARYQFESNTVHLFDCERVNISWIIDIKRSPFNNFVSLKDLISSFIDLYDKEITNKYEFLSDIQKYIGKRKIKINKKNFFPKNYPLITLAIFLKFDILLFNSYESFEYGYFILNDLYDNKIIDQEYQPIFLATNSKDLSDQRFKQFKSVNFNYWHF